MRKKISLPVARRIALAAAGFARPRPKRRVKSAQISQVIRQLGLLQLDYVNVLVPAHLLVLFSRLGAYDRELFHELVYGGRDFIEHWAHEASIVPADLWPMLEYRRQDYRPYPNSPLTKLNNQSKYLSQVTDLIEKRAPLTAADLPPVKSPKRGPGDWHRSLPRWALEYHFGKGNIAVANRLPNFQRVYDMPERLIDATHLQGKLSRSAAQQALLLQGASAFGVATADDLADYFRMAPKEARAGINALTEQGELNEIAVEGWTKPAYLHRSAKIPRRISAASLLSPFDPVVWYRPPAARLFYFHDRIEIYVPAKKRKWGYYVLPFLLDDRIVARVDLKADRKNRKLLVLASHSEANIDQDKTLATLAAELLQLANWLGLERIKVSRRGSFARALADVVRDF